MKPAQQFAQSLGGERIGSSHGTCPRHVVRGRAARQRWPASTFCTKERSMIEFEESIERILSHEGGYVNNPADPGGETQWGIAKRSYPSVDIKALTRDGAKEIYNRDFWGPVANTVSNSALRFQLLDAAVNHGMGNAVRFLQRAIGVADDGHWGPVSRKVLDAMDPHDAHLLFMAERFEFWCKLTTFQSFGKGWIRRGAQNLRYLAADN